MRNIGALLIGILLFASCAKQNKDNTTATKAPFMWENANIYFLLTDRFNNGTTENDINFDRTSETGTLRGFMGGDLKGITQKIEEGYFNKLGVNAIWFSPVVEQIHGAVDEGTGNTYGFHGYWAKDWTKIEPNFGTKQDLAEMVEKAHAHGIRVVLDVVINHTGPATKQDPVWPSDWVRTKPQCKYDNYQNTVSCTLVENLPDILTGSKKEVQLPDALRQKWEQEGRLDQEIQELELFFNRTKLPRTPRNYIIKWLTDYIREYGIDGYRVDTAKHTEEDVWSDLYKEAVVAFADWKRDNPESILDSTPFYMVGEVYGYGISGGRLYHFSDRSVDYFSHGMKSLINFEFKYDAKNNYEELFSKYSEILHNQLKGKTILNYAASHDDGVPFDQARKNSFEVATKLLLCPGSSQIYYGDETNRSLMIQGAVGDATLRSFMNWEDLEQNKITNGVATKDILTHWQKLGQFRAAHPSVGAGTHKMINKEPYIFTREYNSPSYNDKVLVGLQMSKGKKVIEVANIFANKTKLKDYYSGTTVTVEKNKIEINTPYSIVLFGK